MGDRRRNNFTLLTGYKLLISTITYRSKIEGIVRCLINGVIADRLKSDVRLPSNHSDEMTWSIVVISRSDTYVQYILINKKNS